jgi:fluoroquinolone resistance protein
MQFTADKNFTKEDFNANPLLIAEYDNCTFENCNFENTKLIGIVFTDCAFIDCNLGNAKISGAAFKNTEFKNCKLLGLNFASADPFLFEASFEGCIMQLVSFYKLKLKNFRFTNCQLRDADFAEADLTGASFKECDLANAVFDNTILEKADLRSAYNYTIDPEQNRLKKAKFSKEGLAGLLYKHNIDIE